MQNTARNWTRAVLAAAFTAGSLPVFADVIQTFDDPLVLGSTQAAGQWYTDRYAPAGFASQTIFDGDNRLHQNISSAESVVSRPSNFSSSFYNTQGRKYDVTTTYLSIDLWIPSQAYLDSVVGTRFAGFWGSALDGSLTPPDAYPIIEFRRQGAANDGNWGFSYYDSSVGFVDLGLPTGTWQEAWHTLEMEFVGDTVNFTVGGMATQSLQLAGFYEFDNTILQGHNTQTGVNYSIYWDNLRTEQAPVPEPATMTLLGLGLAGLIARTRKRA